MKAFAFRALIGIAVLGLFSVFLINTGKMPAIVSFANSVFGTEVGEGVETFGNTSKQVVDGEYKPNIDPGSLLNVDEARKVLLGTPETPSERIPDYDRDAFGRAWTDVDGNHCNTRDDMLARDLTKITKDGACKVLTGDLADPYTGSTIHFTRGAPAAGVDIDHIASLGWAWDNGAWKWTPEQRLNYANDPMVLMSVSAAENRSKSDKGPGEWMPKNQAFHCTFAQRYLAITTKYNLSLPSADKDALNTALGTCH